MTDSILDRFQPDAVVMFVGVHPDDETLISPLLAFAADRCREVIVFSLTRGESGWNLHKENLTRTLAQVREAELQAAAKILGATPIAFDYINGTTQAHPDGLAVLDLEQQAATRRQAPGGHDASPEASRQRWTRQTGDPLPRLVQLLQQKRPTVIFALDPEKGVTGHTEHIALAPIALDAFRQYNRTARPKAVFYYVYDTADTGAGAERILTENLNKIGGRDYVRIAYESQTCYETQYGTRGSERSRKNVGHRHAQQLIKRVE